MQQVSTPRRVVIVDDNEDAALSLAMVCGAWGHEVHTACGGREAIALCGEFSPEIAILDISMPGMNGYELARELRRRFGVEVVLIALTALSQLEDKGRAREAGFNHHMVKPAELDALHELICAR
jgi:DNA-binding response OmpR family regulator